jgi:hypothetical protein
MNRRHFLGLAAITGTGLFTGCVTGSTPQTAKLNKPNILFILIDDMGWKDIACAGSTYYETPHIDELAANGMRFVNAYSSSPVCTPSRGAIFSGKNPARTKLTTVFSASTGTGDRLFKWRGLPARNSKRKQARPSNLRRLCFTTSGLIAR